MSKDGIHIDLNKMQAIVDCVLPKLVIELRSFHSLAIFCRRVLRRFNKIATPFIGCLKKGQFKWGKDQKDSYNLLKQKLT